MAAVDYDLHIHTTASDGKLSPAEVVQLAKRCGLSGIAITDHDTVSGLADPILLKIAADDGMQVLSGIEINTDFEDEEVHILGYFINVTHPQLLKRLAEIKKARLDRTEKIINRLQAMHLDVSLDRVYEVAGNGTVGRPHIAQVMIENGYAGTIKEAFEKYLVRGGPAYVPRYRLLPDEAIRLIKMAGGVSILAHPGLIKNQMLINKIVEMDVMGIEVFYPEHTEYQIHNLLNFAHTNGLLITGGSDFHGTENSRNHIGGVGLDISLFQQFIQQSQK